MNPAPRQSANQYVSIYKVLQNHLYRFWPFFLAFISDTFPDPKLFNLKFKLFWDFANEIEFDSNDLLLTDANRIIEDLEDVNGQQEWTKLKNESFVQVTWDLNLYFFYCIRNLLLTIW